jgi:hypothetical protein
MQTRRLQLILGGSIVTMAVAIGGSYFLTQQEQHPADQISSQQDTITNSEYINAISAQIETVDRSKKLPLVYHVRLQNVPVGEKLTLTCDWLNPSGKVVKRDRYTTPSVTTPVWNTHCQYQLSPSPTPGKWQVRMVLNGKKLSDRHFIVN